ncbi:MAG: YbaB/EbfC family nucleoid-associated protein [Chitinispirillaceae bacterium]|jgi:hypothetical protein|nr:YbaB/EbfC family nucleoid-associated protein [Chitinispirillaceae bacterium]
MQNFNKMLKQAQQMQSQMMKVQEEFAKREIEGSAGGGMVRIVLNGANQLVSVKINPEVVVASETEMLEDLIVAAHAQAAEKLKEASDAAFGSVTGGLKLPGM